MKNSMVIPVFAALIALTATAGHCQDVWEAFLTQREAVDVARDGRYVWLATAGGVLRWDTEGTGPETERFTVFLPQDGLGAVSVVSLAIDGRGNKWFAHSAPDVGVSLLDSAGNWSVVSSFDGLGLAPGRGVKVVHASSDSLWVGTSSGATLFENRERKILLTEDDDGILSDNILSIETFEGEVWLGTERGLSRFDLHGVRNYTAETDSLPDNRINALAVDPDGKLWIGTDTGIAWIVNDEVVPVEGLAVLQNFKIRDIAFEVGPLGEIIPWFATDNGPYRQSTRLALQTSGVLIGAPEETNAILVDESDDIWCANGNRWLFEFDHNQDAWINRRLTGMTTNFVSDLVIDKEGFVWTANYSNRDEKDNTDAKDIHLFNGDRWTNILVPRSLQQVVGVAVDSAGNRWFCSRNTESNPGNLFMLPAAITSSVDSTDFTYFKLGGGPLNWPSGAQPSFNIEVDPFGNVWGLVTERGVAALDTLQDVQRWGTWTSPGCLRDDEFAGGTFGPSVIDIAFTPDGRAWIALELSTSTIIDYGSSLDASTDDSCFDWDLGNSPIPNKLRTIRVDPRGRVWFGAADGGIAVFDPSDSTWVNYTRESTNGGLPDNRIRGIAFDRSGNTWIGTLGGGIGVLRSNGTTWLEPYKVETNRRRGAGLTTNDIQEIRPYVNDQGVEEIWIATWGGGVIRLVPDLSEPADEGDETRPATIAYPNPYKAGEEDRDGIAFLNVPVGSVVDIYTLTGEFVKEINGPATAGEAAILEPEWDLSNDQNVPVASGVYLFAVRIDGALYQTGKIAYLR